MANNKGQADKYIDLLITELSLKKIETNLLIRDFMLILSPGIQGEKTKYLDISVSKINSVRNKMDNFSKNYLLIRFYDVFLIGDLVKFLNLMTNEKFIYSPPGNATTRKWQYAVEEDNFGYFIYLTKNPKEKFRLELVKHSDIKEYFNYFNEDVSYQNINNPLSKDEFIPHVYSYITSKGFTYLENNIKNLYLSLRTKPFIIISGISGTGKTKIVQLFAEAIGATEENEQFKLIPVRPDWSDSSDLLGYRDIKGEFWKGPLTKIVEHALANPDLPHFVLLDEMNLARVEYYFSDVLSVMESRKKDEEGNFTSSPLITFEENEEEKTVTLPGNLYVIGTVNMDETTHSFSKKVLDRANTIEFNEIDLMNFDAMVEKESVKPIQVSNDVLESTYIHLIDAFSAHEPLIRQVSEKINAINESLKVIHAQVGYRVRDEISFYMAHNAEAGMLLTENEAMDFCIMQKILPRISGTQNIVEPVLEKLEIELKPYEKCSKKIEEMKKRLDDNGFVSFWTA
ncbi:McrB family protein [Lysinibacillus antri]|uniref:ATPase dynein-related AAA domain-containing protein n=1 Tax=Lysinibacillus antri TaxID=2498145 RepID=A0A3S0RW98_9BACI|nr:AAA family ATPase [Lysinibacillus antri]RUL53945.1 hypothetical protein EK386_07390 [Lysinibacillus antri]